MKFSGQSVDQRLTLNESQRKTVLTFETPRSSNKSFSQLGQIGLLLTNRSVKTALTITTPWCQIGRLQII